MQHEPFRSMVCPMPKSILLFTDCIELKITITGYTGLYRGLVSLLYFSIPKVAVRFGAFEMANNRLQNQKTGEITPGV